MHTGIRALLGQCSTPGQLLQRLNELLLERELGASFVTCLAALITPDTGDAVLSSAGHPHPVCVSEGKAPRLVPLDNNLIIGAFGETGFADTHWRFPESTSTLLMYSDGVSEAFNEYREQFGTERLLEALSTCGSRSAPEIVQAVQSELAAFRGRQEQSDDLTLLACRRTSIS
jgi:sigma-B regulation protein RsbU (phosphoserine phosphatase)